MNKKPAFTIVELIIVIGLSGLIFIFLTQSLTRSIKLLNLEGRYSKTDRTVSLLFNQMDKDLSSAMSSFIATSDEDSIKIEEEQKPLLKSLNFISTHPLEVYGNKNPNRVRICYELKKSDELYDLWRKETFDLDNIKFEEPRDKKTLIKKHKVAEKIKGLSIEYGFIENDKIKYEFEWSKNSLPLEVKVILIINEKQSYKILIPILSAEKNNVQKK